MKRLTGVAIYARVSTTEQDPEAQLLAWLPAAQAPDGALLLQHLSQQHPDQVRASLDRIQTTEDIGRVAAEAYAVMEEHV
jgi:hypothetical protein